MGKGSRSRSRAKAARRHIETLPSDVEGRQFAKRHGVRIFAASPNDWYLFSRRTGEQIGRWFVRHGTLQLFGASAPKARTIREVVKLIAEMYPEQMTPKTVNEMNREGQGGSDLPVAGVQSV